MLKEPSIAIFGMGCFWCAEAAFRDATTHDLLPGILSLRVGYAGGVLPNPTYESHLGYKEALRIAFDPGIIAYEDLLALFWRNVDPLDAEGQFADRGFAYTSVIFYTTLEQKEAALKSEATVKQKIDHSFTEIIEATSFYDAEEYHQNYKVKNPVTYCYYRLGCGRDRRLKQVWEPKPKA